MAADGHRTGHRAGQAAAIVTAFLLATACFLGTLSGTAKASVNYTAIGNAALNWAEYHATGHPYVYGGTGPGYDCSGLVMVAFEHEGIDLPHNTQAMVDSGHLVRVSVPQRGDIAMWFSGGVAYHVGFVTIWKDMAFGALDTGTPIGWYSWAGWPPAAFYQVRLARSPAALAAGSMPAATPGYAGFRREGSGHQDAMLSSAAASWADRYAA